MSEASAVATFICSPAAPALDDALLKRLVALLPQAQQPLWLAPGVAADIPCAALDWLERRDAVTRLTEEIGAAPIDLYVGPAQNRRAKLFLADMDSTIIAQECIDELADMAGFKDEVAALTERAMAGEIAFEPALRARVALLKGLKTTIVDEILQSRIKLNPGAREAVATMRAHGAYCALVSGGFTVFTQKIADQVGFNENRANRLIAREGVFTGEVETPILGANAKLEALRALRDRFGLEASQIIAVGDGANDIPMLEEAGLGCAFHAKSAVTKKADFSINHGDLTALLYVQGYRRDAFVSQ